MSKRLDQTWIDRIAAAIAEADSADYWVPEITDWETSEEWKREAYPDEYPSSAYEDRERYRKQARAALLALEPEGREVTGQGYSNAHEITVEMLSDLLAEVGIVTPGNEQRLSKFASAIVQKVEARLPAREIPDAEVAAAYSAFVQASFGFPGAPAMRAALEASRDVSGA